MFVSHTVRTWRARVHYAPSIRRACYVDIIAFLIDFILHVDKHLEAFVAKFMSVYKRFLMRLYV